jgi:hypothetical protein
VYRIYVDAKDVDISLLCNGDELGHLTKRLQRGGSRLLERRALPSFRLVSAIQQHLPTETPLCIFTYHEEKTGLRSLWVRHESASGATDAPAKGVRRSLATPV